MPGTLDLKGSSVSYNKPDLLSDKIIEFLSSSDYTVVNVEAPITDSPSSSGEVLVHVNSSKILPILNKINANVWNIGTNHAMDCGAKGIANTLEFAQKSGTLNMGWVKTLTRREKPL